MPKDRLDYSTTVSNAFCSLGLKVLGVNFSLKGIKEETIGVEA